MIFVGQWKINDIKGAVDGSPVFDPRPAYRLIQE
jgi:hypothetical protein